MHIIKIIFIKKHFLYHKLWKFFFKCLKFKPYLYIMWSLHTISSTQNAPIPEISHHQTIIADAHARPRYDVVYWCWWWCYGGHILREWNYEMTSRRLVHNYMRVYNKTYTHFKIHAYMSLIIKCAAHTEKKKTNPHTLNTPRQKCNCRNVICAHAVIIIAHTKQYIAIYFYTMYNTLKVHMF